MKTFWLETVDSTNSEALRRLPELADGTVLAAREQTAGRGQRGNTWFTEAGKNLTFSIVLKALPLKAADSVRLNFLTSVAVASFLESHGVDASIKWPNDIYVGSRKICGMLIENTLGPGGQLMASVIGIGINVNQTEFPQLANATSMALCTGKEYELEPALEGFLGVFESWFSRLDSEELFATYSARLFRKGVSAPYHDLLTDREYTGVIEGVEPDGRLHIRDTEGNDLYYRFKEVSYIL
ncbi:MAG: biotin--[acetyl-CoA-carboxylase] ligase [Bacteroidales bacterium]|nr:biotin--[acetyl-CoA-carboxylase] ligase [Bacteroidales bacterium]